MLGGATVDALWSDVSKRRRIQDPKPINAMKDNKVGRQSLEGETRQDVQAQVVSTMAGAVRATQGVGQGVGRLGRYFGFASAPGTRDLVYDLVYLVAMLNRCRIYLVQNLFRALLVC